jgi:hypothetical protein
VRGHCGNCHRSLGASIMSSRNAVLWIVLVSFLTIVLDISIAITGLPTIQKG